MRKSAADLVDEARAEMENLDVDAVEQELGAGDAVLVDIRKTHELEANGRIPGAVHMSRGMLELYADPTSPYPASRWTRRSG